MQYVGNVDRRQLDMIEDMLKKRTRTDSWLRRWGANLDDYEYESPHRQLTFPEECYLFVIRILGDILRSNHIIIRDRELLPAPPRFITDRIRVILCLDGGEQTNLHKAIIKYSKGIYRIIKSRMIEKRLLYDDIDDESYNHFINRVLVDEMRILVDPYTRSTTSQQEESTTAFIYIIYMLAYEWRFELN